MTKCCLRRPLANELDLIADLHIRSEIASTPGSAREASYRNQDRNQKAESWKRFLLRPGHDMLVHEQADYLSGFVAFGPGRGSDVHLGEIYTLYVDPSCWRRGIGEVLGNAAMKALHQQGFQTIGLWVYADNLPAIRLYQRLGFLASGRQKRNSNADESLALRFENQLSIEEPEKL